jgi:outer membrane biosynthesis protein TonB
MTIKSLALVSVIGLAGICLVQGQSPTPGESPAASPSPAESPAASPSPAKHRAHKKAEATATASPAAKRKTKTSAASPAPATRTTAAATTPVPGGGPGMVWVSTNSHIYHKQGSRFYGKTKNGKYMSEADARKEGNRPAAHEY